MGEFLLAVSLITLTVLVMYIKHQKYLKQRLEKAKNNNIPNNKSSKSENPRRERSRSVVSEENFNGNINPPNFSSNDSNSPFKSQNTSYYKIKNINYNTINHHSPLNTFSVTNNNNNNNNYMNSNQKLEREIRGFNLNDNVSTQNFNNNNVNDWRESHELNNLNEAENCDNIQNSNIANFNESTKDLIYSAKNKSLNFMGFTDKKNSFDNPLFKQIDYETEKKSLIQTEKKTNLILNEFSRGINYFGVKKINFDDCENMNLLNLTSNEKENSKKEKEKENFYKEIKSPKFVPTNLSNLLQCSELQKKLSFMSSNNEVVQNYNLISNSKYGNSNIKNSSSKYNNKQNFFSNVLTQDDDFVYSETKDKDHGNIKKEKSLFEDLIPKKNVEKAHAEVLLNTPVRVNEDKKIARRFSFSEVDNEHIEMPKEDKEIEEYLNEFQNKKKSAEFIQPEDTRPATQEENSLDYNPANSFATPNKKKILTVNNITYSVEILDKNTSKINNLNNNSIRKLSDKKDINSNPKLIRAVSYPNDYSKLIYNDSVPCQSNKKQELFESDKENNKNLINIKSKIVDTKILSELIPKKAPVELSSIKEEKSVDNESGKRLFGSINDIKNANSISSPNSNPRICLNKDITSNSVNQTSTFALYSSIKE